MIQTILNEDIFKTDGDNSVDLTLSNQLVDLIKAKLDIIDRYNNLKNYYLQLNRDISVIDDMISKESEQLDTLQDMLKELSPSMQ